MHVALGNVAPIEVKNTWEDGELVSSERIPLGDRQVTSASVQEENLADAIATIIGQNGFWNSHSDAPAAWVVSDNKALEAVLADHFQCPAGEPEEGIDAWMGIEPPADVQEIAAGDVADASTVLGEG